MSSNTIRSWPSHESSSRAVEDRSSTAGRSSATTRSPGIVQESESQENECTICYEVTTSSEYCTVQPCGHVFDYTCIMRWLESQWRSTGQIIRLTCPLCRRLIHHLRHQYDEERSTYRTLDLRHHFRNERPEERSQLDVFTRNDDIQREYINETRRRMSTPALAIDGRNRGNGLQTAIEFDILALEANVAEVRRAEEWHLSLPLTAWQRQTARRIAQELIQQAFQAMDNWESGRVMSETDRTWGRPITDNTPFAVTRDLAYYDFMDALARLT